MGVMESSLPSVVEWSSSGRIDGQGLYRKEAVVESHAMSDWERPETWANIVKTLAGAGLALAKRISYVGSLVAGIAF